MTRPTITDVCLVTRDLDTAVEFYLGKLDFELDSRMPGFADFTGPGVVLALWDAQLIRDTTGVPAQVSEPDGHGVMIAVELESPERIDETYQRLTARGVEFYRPPADYPWNARCIYFPGPCGEFWEFFAWHEGGKPGRPTPDAPTAD
jgi:catechol 2,3-dioxygenase-like lactoylglutathione lyase family enzyme